VSSTVTKQERERAVELLRERLPKGTRLFGLTKQGLAVRYVRLFVATEPNQVQEITALAARACAIRYSAGGVRPHGAAFRGHGYSALGEFASDLGATLHGSLDAFSCEEL
jgi:hypothetical protein